MAEVLWGLPACVKHLLAGEKLRMQVILWSRALALKHQGPVCSEIVWMSVERAPLKLDTEPCIQSFAKFVFTQLKGHHRLRDRTIDSSVGFCLMTSKGLLFQK